MSEKLVSKVLVLDRNPEFAELIKNFCDANDLIGLKISKGNLMRVLEKNIDLGAILYSEDYGDTPEENADIALKIHALRPELPIILRRKTKATLEDLSSELQDTFCAAYTADDMSILRKVVDEYIFSFIYPNALVRGVTEIADSVLRKQFPFMLTTWETPPYLVRDRIIFGEVFSLIPLESAWCRGYMMLQTEEEPLIDVLDSCSNGAYGNNVNFRTVNSFLGEITNLIWGAFKNRYIGDNTTPQAHEIQVPIVVNHKHKCISFGSEDPQLCFCCIMTHPDTGYQLKFYMRFIFNLNWSPEHFKELTPDVQGLVEAGELELF